MGETMSAFPGQRESASTVGIPAFPVPAFQSASRDPSIPATELARTRSRTHAAASWRASVLRRFQSGGRFSEGARGLSPSKTSQQFGRAVEVCRGRAVTPVLEPTRHADWKVGVTAFTLIELLVVVAIIAILASLLLPTLSRAKGAARSAECRNNLHTMGLAMRMYLDDFNAYPPTQGMGIMGFDQAYGWLMEDDWKMELVPFIGVKDDRFVEREDTMRVLRCPQLVSNEDGKRGQGQYALNASGTAKFKDPLNLGLGGCSDGTGWQVRPTAESRVRTPADLAAVGDVTPGPTLAEVFWTSGHFDVCSTNRTFWPGSSHGGGANLVFADGHVESAPQTNWVSVARRHRWNNDGQPHPETWQRR